MMNPLPKLLLASSSPRRRQLLEALGLSFEIVPAAVEELDPSSDQIELGVLENARRKGIAGLQSSKNPTDVVIAADTLVVLNKDVLGKPKSPADVLFMLGQLSGKTHQVITGMVLQTPGGMQSQVAVSSWVTFRSLSASEIKDYASTREPYDKAGSYAIQGLGATFIEKIEGSYTNIMGFPIERFLIELPKVTGIPMHKWFLP